jgi:hypothetical protein
MRGAGVDATVGCTTAADAVAVDMAASVADVAASDRSTGSVGADVVASDRSTVSVDADVSTAERSTGSMCADVAAADRSTGVTTTRDMPQWRTRGNLHLDLNPWTYNAGRSDAVPADTLTFDNLR